MVLDANVTRREISLGARGSTTGWCSIIDPPPETTIECVPLPRGATFRYESIGVYASVQNTFLTADPVNVYDQLKPSDGKYYEVQTVQEHWLLDSFVFRELQCTEMPLWQSPPSTSATWKTSPTDPRSRTKTWIDTYVRDTSIRKDDGVSPANWVCMFADPPYPMVLELYCYVTVKTGRRVEPQPYLTHRQPQGTLLTD